MRPPGPVCLRPDEQIGHRHPPAALLVVFWWRRGRLEWRRDVVPLSPWFAIAAVSGLFSAWVERTYIGARGEAFDLGFGQRLLLSGRIVWFYLAKLLWPRNLIFIYPRWRVDGHQAWQYLFLLGVVAVTAGLWLLRRRTRAPLAAFLFFVGSLFPVLDFSMSTPSSSPLSPTIGSTCRAWA